jgi:thiamine-phosphate diphosphorylase
MDLETQFEIKKFAAAPVFFSDRKKVLDLEKTIKNLPKNSWVIFREYDLDKKNREILAQKISRIARSKSLKMLVGKDFALARKIKANGVHFSDKEKIPLHFLQKKSFPKNFILSIACHDLHSFLRIKKLPVNAIFLAPIFPTTSHAQGKNLGINFLRKISHNKEIAKKIFALGGINSKNIKTLRRLGIAGFGAIDLFSHNK